MRDIWDGSDKKLRWASLRLAVQQILFGLLAGVRPATNAVVHLAVAVQVRHVPVGSATARNDAVEWLLEGVLAPPFPPVVHAHQLKHSENGMRIRNRIANIGTGAARFIRPGFIRPAN